MEKKKREDLSLSPSLSSLSSSPSSSSLSLLLFLSLSPESLPPSFSPTRTRVRLPPFSRATETILSRAPFPLLRLSISSPPCLPLLLPSSPLMEMLQLSRSSYGSDNDLPTFSQTLAWVFLFLQVVTALIRTVQSRGL